MTLALVVRSGGNAAKKRDQDCWQLASIVAQDRVEDFQDAMDHWEAVRTKHSTTACLTWSEHSSDDNHSSCARAKSLLDVRDEFSGLRMCSIQRMNETYILSGHLQANVLIRKASAYGWRPSSIISVS